MQAIMETLFDIFYLTSVITLGVLMVSRKQAKKQYQLFGIMAILLGFGDAFHLNPRAFALWTTGLENHAFSLGMGKLITSITMTIFYVILYHVWRMRYHITEKKSTDCRHLYSGLYSHHPLSLPPERMDKPRCAFVLGDLPKHPLHHHGDSHHHPVLSKHLSAP